MSTTPPSRQGKAAVFNGHGKPFELVTKLLPALKPGEILVKTLYTTICGSDVHTYCGRRQEPDHVVLGHEIVGEVIDIHPTHPGTDYNGAAIQQGNRVIWAIFAAAVNAMPPQPDMPQKSRGIFKYGHAAAIGNDVFNGGLAEFCILKENTALIKMPQSVPLAVAATIGCAHATTAGALRVAGEIKGKKVLVFGMGLLGLSCIAMCKEAGAAFVGAVDNNALRLESGKAFGATALYDSSLFEASETSALPEADIVIDMSGSTPAMETGIKALAIGGCAVWIGAVFPAPPVQVDAQLVVRKLLQIRGLHNYNYQDFVNAAGFIIANHNKYPFHTLVEKEFPLDDVEEAFTFASVQKPVRAGIKF